MATAIGHVPEEEDPKGCRAPFFPGCLARRGPEDPPRTGGIARPCGRPAQVSYSAAFGMPIDPVIPKVIFFS
ncbi:hypothetical protein [Streptomyces thermovulgaris]|uniref:hypothetical protein n=1 Tax=Streptomyces thermovulgaris TaxID=1934 RepID=UPI000A35FC3A